MVCVVVLWGVGCGMRRVGMGAVCGVGWCGVWRKGGVTLSYMLTNDRSIHCSKHVPDVNVGQD